MSKKVAIVICPNWRDYGQKYLAACIRSIRSLDYPHETKVFITDNETSEASVNFIKKTAPEAAIHKNIKNDGFAKGVNDSIRAGLEWGADYIFVVNLDAEVAPDSLRQLVRAMESDSRIGAAQARLMMYPDKKMVNSLGNVTHFLGFGYCLGYREKWDSRQEESLDHRAKDQLPKINCHDIHYPSGAGVLFSRECLKQVGLYDQEYWMYNEDQEHGWRIWLAGFRCVIAPRAIVYHKYEFGKSIKQFYYMDRNRIITILLCYKINTLFLILPAFIVMEMGLLLFARMNGWWREKINVYKYFLKRDTWDYLKVARARNQGLRRVSDARIGKLISGTIWYQEIDDWKLRAINPVFETYWRIIRLLIIW